MRPRPSRVASAREKLQAMLPRASLSTLPAGRHREGLARAAPPMPGDGGGGEGGGRTALARRQGASCLESPGPRSHGSLHTSGAESETQGGSDSGRPRESPQHERRSHGGVPAGSAWLLLGLGKGLGHRPREAWSRRAKPARPVRLSRKWNIRPPPAVCCVSGAGGPVTGTVVTPAVGGAPPSTPR